MGARKGGAATFDNVTDQFREEFWSRVAIKEDSECWPWLAAQLNVGYGACRFNRACSTAHSVALFLATGTKPNGLYTLHKCDNRLCCNPSHLWLGTHDDNMHDMAKKKRAGRYSKPERTARGESCRSAKLTEQQVHCIRQEYTIGKMTLAALASEYNVSIGAIHSAVRYRTWRHVA